MENFYGNDAARVCLIAHTLQSAVNIVTTRRLSLLLGRRLARIRSDHGGVACNWSRIISVVHAEDLVCVRIVDKDCGDICLRITICHAIEPITTVLGLQVGRWCPLRDHHVRRRLYHNADIVKIYGVAHGHSVPI